MEYTGWNNTEQEAYDRRIEAKRKLEIKKTDTDCRSEEGITVGLIDAILSIGRIVRLRLEINITTPAVLEALKDLQLDSDIKKILEMYKTKYINNELGIIAIDENTGHKIYEDIVHDLGNGYCKYYIQGNSLTNTHFIIPEREDIPKESWGQEVQSRWIQFPKVK